MAQVGRNRVDTSWADFLASKGKKKEALVFEALVATRPAWSLLL